MKKRKLTRKKIDELVKVMPVLSESMQRSFVGGGNGTEANPFTEAEYDQMSADGTWKGGYVDGWGYTFGEVVVTGSYNGSNSGGSGDSGSFNKPNEWGGSDSGFWNAFRNDPSDSNPDDSGYWWGYWADGKEQGEPTLGGGGGGVSSSSTNSTTQYAQSFDVAKVENWLTQKPKQCYDACVQILKKYGIEVHDRTNRIIAADQKGSELIAKNTKNTTDYINSELKKGNPVIVGVDDNSRQSTYNNHKATEHFIVIVGTGNEEGKAFYRFFDVGSKTSEAGTSTDNKLYLTDSQLLQGENSTKSHTYTITEVRKNK